MGIAEILKLLFSLAPTVITTIQAVEKAIPAPGAGAQKLDAVLETVTAAVKAVPAVTDSTGETIAAVKSGDVENITLGLSHMIGAFVNLFNATGTFQKTVIVKQAAPVSLADHPNPGIRAAAAIQEQADAQARTYGADNSGG